MDESVTFIYKDISLASINNIKIISIVILILASAVLCLPLQLYAEDIPDSSSFMDMKSSIEQLLSNVNKVRSSVVTIVTYDSSGEMRSGSGVFIDTEGRIITNASVIKNAYSAEVYSERTHYEKVTLLNSDASVDIAILQVNAVNEVSVGIDYEYKARSGDRVVVVGKPSGFRITVSEGLISKVSRIGEDFDYIEIETTTGLLTYKYSKDGPVINMEGRVVGITTKSMPEFRDEPFPQELYGDVLPAVSINRVKTLAAGPYRKEEFKPPGEKIWSLWFVRNLKESIVSIFLTLYQFGFKRIMSMAVKLLLLAVLVIWIMSKFKLIKLH